MGTSSSSSGPKGKSPLLPNWAPDSDNYPDQNQDDENQDSSNQESSDEGENQENNTDVNHQSNNYVDDFRGARSALTRAVGRGSGTSFRRATRNYIRKLGGRKGATISSSAGIRVAQGFASFWQGVSNKGIDQTLRDYSLSDYVGKPTEIVFARIADAISPDGSTDDDAIARSAVMMALDRLYDKLLEENKDIKSLDNLDATMLKNVVIEFVSAYIFKKYIYEVGISLERNDLSEIEAIQLESQMKNFIRDEVKSGLKEIDVSELEFEKGAGLKVIENIFDIAYSTLEK